MSFTHTPQRCIVCGHKEKYNRLEQKCFKRIQSRYSANNDHRAVRNILAAEHAILACGASSV